jgi:hypothetical protein
LRDARPGTTPGKPDKPKKPAQSGAAAVGAAVAPKPELVSEHGAGQHANVKPAFAGHFEPPNPLLQKLGFNGGMQAFNEHVHAIADAHRATFGYLPSPGLTLDLARSDLGVTEYKNLFPSQNTRIRDATRTITEHDKTGDFLHVGQDGVLQRTYPFAKFVSQTLGGDTLGGAAAGAAAQTGPELVSEHGAGQQANVKPRPAAVPTLAALQKKYPNVQMGMLPIPGAETVYSALAALDAKGGLTNAVTQQGMTLEEFQQEVKRGQPFESTAQQRAAAQLQNMQIPGLTPEEKAQRSQAVGKQVLVGQATTLKDAQRELNKVMGTHLPETGFFNQDWTDTLSNWFKSADYFRAVTKRQAQDAGFGDDVGAYLKAWRSKQKAVRQHGLAAHFLSALPLPLFGNGLTGAVKAVPGYIVHGGTDPVTMGLHALQHSAGLTLSVVGGTVSQAKADAAAASSLSHAIIGKAFGSNKSFDDALKDASEALRANPTWLHIVAPEVNFDSNQYLRALDQGTNLVGDVLLIRKPSFTGERVAAGDLAAASKSGYVNATSHWAYDYITRGKNARASEMLESGQGANRLITAAAPLIKSGKMTREQFTQHAAELYAKGHTTVTVKGKDVQVWGPLLHSLRDEQLPTPGFSGRAWLSSKRHLNDWLDNFDKTFRASNFGGTDHAASLVASLRSAVSHAAPRGARGMFDKTLPNAVKQFVRKNKLGDEAYGEKLASQIVRYQAKENVVGLQRVQRDLERRYHLTYPVSTSGGVPSEFEAVLGTEAPSVFHFPGGGHREVDGALGAIENARAKTTAALNKWAKVRSRLVLASGASLFYKHAVADPLRAVVGGGFEKNAGAMREISDLAGQFPEYERKLGVFLARTTQGETRWVLGRGGAVPVPSFRTGERFTKPQYMTAAGGQLRRLLTDDALAAYQASNSGRQIDPLVQLVLNNKTYRGMWKAARREAGRAEANRLGVDRLTPDQYRNVLPAEEYAQQIAWRFRDFEEAANEAGVSDPFVSAVNTLRVNRGAKADRALGKWIADNRVDFQVDSPKVEQIGSFDSITGKIISTIMAPNKLARRHFAEATLSRTFAELRKAGFTHQEAFETASAVAEKLVEYHMLDFVNRLQIEQDLRWVSWFATKHRLYWKWVIGTLARHPFVASAVQDVQHQLDDNGNIPFTLFGRRLDVPLTRLLWIPGREYNETSPDVQFVWGVIKSGGDLSAGWKAADSTYGNVFTRLDTTVRLGIKLARVATGNLPATYGAASAGMDEKSKAQLNRQINQYQLNYYAEHGHYAPETEAVKHVLAQATAEEFWRSTLPFPVLPDYQPSKDQRLLREFMATLDPKKRSAFLDRHPGLADQFGVYDTPRKFLHNREMFGRFVKALDAMRAARADLFEQSKKDGFTADLLTRKREVDAAFQKTVDTLLREDARWAGHEVADSQIPGVNGAPLGPWGRLLNADPQMNPRHALNALFPKLKVKEYGKVYGELQQQLKAELALLNNEKYAATYPDQDELKQRRGEILQQLEAFQRFPSDALGSVYAKYQQSYVGPYWKHIEDGVAAINKLPSDEHDKAYADLRAWRDQQDRDVTINGVKFPSPVRMAWATLDPQTRRERLAYFASKSWEHLTNYEKELLTGKPVNPYTSELWAQLEDAKQSYKLAGNYNSYTTAQLKAWFLKVDRTKDDQGKRPYAGVYQDFLFAQRPLVRRLEVMPLITESRYHDQWQGLFQAAKEYAKDLASPDYAGQHDELKGAWRKYVKSAPFQAWLNDSVGFRKEVDRFGPDFLNMLIGGN